MVNWRVEVRRRLARLELEPTREAEIVEELAADLDDRFQELRRRGLSAPEAEAQLIDQHLSDEALSESLRAVEQPAPIPTKAFGQGGGPWWSGIGSDIRYAARSLWKSPGLTLVALLTLAIGIGANTAIFSVVNAALLRPLPFREPDDLVSFWGTAPDKGLPVVAYPDALYHVYRARLKTVDQVAFYSEEGLTVTGSGEPERLTGTNVTVDFFRILGASPIHGRGFTADDFGEGRTAVALLGHRLWQRRFGGDPTVVGRTLLLNNVATTVLGVMPRGFDFPNRSELWIPVAPDLQSLNCWCKSALGRLADGKTATDLAWEVDNANADFWAEREPDRPRSRPKLENSRGTVTMPLARELAAEIRAPALVLSGAVGMVLLIACANLANLLLTRATGRRREIAVRCALGASPRRVARQLLVESLLLSLGGAALGLVVGYFGAQGLGRMAIERLSYVNQVTLDPTVLAFAVALGVGSGLLFGVVPALAGSRTELTPALRDGNRGTESRSRRRLNDGFVVAQLALSLVLLVGAGLLVRSFIRLLRVDPGFDAHNVVVGRVALPWTIYTEMSRVRDFVGRLGERVAALPEVTAVGFSSTSPFSSNNNQNEVIVQGKEPAPNEAIPVASVRLVAGDYYTAVGTPLLRGRVFDHSDRDGTELVAIIDETLARRYWPDGNAIGGRVHLGNLQGTPVWRTVVGVVASTKHRSLEQKPDHYVYTPLSQGPGWSIDLVVRSEAAPLPLIGALRALVLSLDPNIPLYDVHTLDEALGRSLATRKLTNVLLAAFAGAALLLAAIGIYGVMARNVIARVREFGVRLAIGATPGEVRNLVLRRGLVLVGLGTAAGVLGAVVLTQFLGDLLFEVSPLDPLVLIAAPLLLGAAALAACYFPALRATRVDPLEAIRSD